MSLSILLVHLSLCCTLKMIGHIERRFIEVPLGATWVQATMRASGFDTARRFFIDTIQVQCFANIL